MKITCYGARGSIPTSGKQTIKYGGHTACILVEVDNKTLIFDAGTGIRQLGEDLLHDKRDVYLLFSHYHWDHIQGFPFFKPAYQRGKKIHLLSAYLPKENARAVLDQMTSPHFPISGDQIQADVNVMPMDHNNNLTLDDLHITSCALNHPGGGAAYRLEHSQACFAYVTDNELCPPKAIDYTTWDQWLKFLDGVDVLIHDAMYLDEELPRIQGWGHSLISRTLQLAKEAQVKHLILFHHDPDRTDQQLDKILKESQVWMEKQGSNCKVSMAKEKDVYHIMKRKITKNAL